MPNLITTAAQTYTPASDRILPATQAAFRGRPVAPPVHLDQYDQTLPVIEVALVDGDTAYTIPQGAAVNIRMRKPSGTYVYNPALGVSQDRHTAYIAVTAQMTVAAGICHPIIEVVMDGGIAGTGAFPIIIDPNPVPEDAITDTDEYKTIQQLAAETQAAAEIVAENEQALQDLHDNLNAVQNAAKNAQSAAASAAAAEQAAQDAVPVYSRLITIPASAWTGSGSNYQATVASDGVTAETEIVAVSPYAADTSDMDAAIEANAMWTYLETASGQIIYHAASKPNAQIQMTIWIKAMES